MALGSDALYEGDAAQLAHRAVPMIRFTSFWLTLALCALTSAPAARAQTCGDVTGDDIVTSTDALAVLREAVGDEDLICKTGDCLALEARVEAIERDTDFEPWSVTLGDDSPECSTVGPETVFTVPADRTLVVTDIVSRATALASLTLFEDGARRFSIPFSPDGPGLALHLETGIGFPPGSEFGMECVNTPIVSLSGRLEPLD